MQFKFSILSLSIFLLVSCTNKTTTSSGDVPLDSLKLNYAHGFSIRYFKDYKEVIVFSPWVKGDVYAHYYLVSDNKPKVPVDGTKIVVPLQSLAATSVTHFEFLNLLNELKTISAVCSPELIYNEAIRMRFTEGKITNLGDAFNINVERTLQIRPQAVMMSGYNQKDPYAQRVSQAGIPVIFNNEWMETSLLARAEWIKFVAAFYNKEKLADSIFSEVENNYTKMRDLAKSATSKPTIMAGSNFRGTWYMPAGRSYMGQLFEDAGGDYFFKTDTTSGSLPLNTEKVLNQFSKADIWLNCNFNSIEELVKADKKHLLFNPVKNNKVYNFNKRMLATTANDFWESAVARPDLLLSDMISIIHPELLPQYELKFCQQLKTKKQ